MTHDEERVYLIQALISEDTRYAELELPRGAEEQERLLRALMNIRPPKAISREFLNIQDSYLSYKRDMRKTIDAGALKPIRSDERIAVWRGDITVLSADAIVNAGNSALLGCFYPLHSCIDNIIHSRAGIQLRLKCSEIMREQGHGEPPGQAKLTPGYNLPGGYILHTVGPIVSGSVTGRERKLLASCYRSCLELASASGLKSIAFCCISTGEFHFPNREAAKTAVMTVREFMRYDSSIEKVIFDVYKEEDLKIYQELLGEDQ